MIFRWLNHPSFHRDEQLLAILYDLGMASKRQLLAVTGWHPRTLKDRLKQIRKRGSTMEERESFGSKRIRFPVKSGALSILWDG